jgi:hypothetical protein
VRIPAGVNLEALALWESWLASKFKPVNDISRPVIAGHLAQLGDAARQLEVVNHSISRQWVSLHAPRADLVDASAKPRVRVRTSAELEAAARAKGIKDPYELERA